MNLSLPKDIMQTYTDLVSIKIVVNSEATKLAVRKHWDNCTAWLKQNKTATDALKRPFKTEIETIDKLNKPMVEKIKAMQHEADRACIAYDIQQRAKIQAQNQKKLEKFEAKSSAAEADAIANDKPIQFIPLPAMKNEPEKTVIVGDSKQTTVERKSWWLKGHRVPVDAYGLFNGDPAVTFDEYTMKQNMMEIRPGGIEAIPPEYFVLDTAKIGKVIRSGVEIPGIEAITVYGLSGRQV